MTTTEASMEGMFLQNPVKREPRDMEMFLQVREPNEFHYYARGISWGDFTGRFGDDLRQMEVLVYHIPPSLLNPNYWEPLSREAEDTVREKMVGIITREIGGRTEIWRSDQIPKNRMLRDGIEVEFELLLGFALRVSGGDLIKLGEAAAGKGERFEWVAFSSLPEGEISNDTILLARTDLTQMKLSVKEETILYASQDERSVRVIFSDKSRLRRAVSSTVRGFTFNLTGQHIIAMPHNVLDKLIHMLDGLGFTARHDTHFRNKDRTYEIEGRLGKTPWGVHLKSADDLLFGDEKLLIYYDRISGIWAVAT